MKLAPETRTDIKWIIYAILAGPLCLAGSHIISNGYDAESLINAQYNFITVISLFIVGAILGYLREKQWWYLGWMTILIFPIIIFSEALVSPTSHNLWPFELIGYVILVGGPAAFGAALGHLSSPNKI